MKKIFSCLLFITSGLVCAGEVGVINNFTANTPAVAAQVNDNFTTFKTEVNDNDIRINDLIIAVTNLQTELAAVQATNSAQQMTINQLENELAIVQSNTVLSLDGYLSLETINGYDTAEFSEINVMINNGSGTTSGSVDGLGNLIVGYNEDSGFAQLFCSNAQYNDEITCNDNGESWQSYIITGSHNLIVGTDHSYTSYASFIAGRSNVSQGYHSSVSGGANNKVSGNISNINGGRYNHAENLYSGIFGGSSNITSDSYSVVLGGIRNVSSGHLSSISGGYENIADGPYSSILGGRINIASGNYSSVSGGFSNMATGTHSNISGGRENSASNASSSVSGGIRNIASGSYSNVSGGRDRTASGENDWVGGSLTENN